MELSDYIRLLLRGWVLLVALSLLGLAVGGTYLLIQPVLYTASAATYISSSSTSDVSAGAAGSEYAKDIAADLADIASTPYVLNNVRKALRLNTPASELSERIQAQVSTNSSVLQVSATASSPSLAAALANGVVVELSNAVERLNPNVGNAASVARATTVQRATLPTTPASPAVAFDLGVGLLGGFALAVVLILLRQSIDQRVRSIDQIARISRGPVIGSVPTTPPASSGPSILAPERIDAFRGVRSEILEGAAQNRVVVVSGATRNESTAPIAASIAASVANARLTTLLVDAVSTSAPAAPIFKAPTEPGLTEALSQAGPLERIFVPGPIDGLWYLGPGRPTGHRDDAIASMEMTDLLEALIGRFNVVVVNTDAVEDSPIARTIGRQADGVVLVTEMNRSTAPDLRKSAESLERGGVRLIGSLVLNAEIPTSRRRSSRNAPKAAILRA